MKCEKCGESLHPEQKICMNCGTETRLWPGHVNQVEAPRHPIPWKTVAVAAGALVVVIVIISLAMSARTFTPDQVAMKWLDAVSGRSIGEAQKYTTEEFERRGLDESMSERKADEYYRYLYDYKAKCTVSAPMQDVPNDPKTAVVTATFAGEGQTLVNRIHLRLQGRKWKIVQVDG